MSEATAIAVTPAPQEPAIQNEAGALISMIERAARDPSVDVAKMERLFDMQERAEKRRSETAFNAAMADAQAQLEPVGRGTDNKFLGTKYADLAALSQQCTPIIAAHGFGLSFGTGEAKIPSAVRVVCDVTHKGGHSKRYECELPLDIGGKDGKSNKTALQAFGSTTTYGRRYMMMLIFNVATAILDSDGNAPRQPRKSSAESKRDGTADRFNQIKQLFETAQTMDALREISREVQDEINGMPEKWATLLSAEWDLRADTLRGAS